MEDLLPDGDRILVADVGVKAPASFLLLRRGDELCGLEEHPGLPTEVREVARERAES